MSWITAADALEELQNLTNPTVQDIKDTVSRVQATTPPGKILYLYSGDFGGDEAWEIVDGLKASNSNIVNINDTQVGQLLTDDIFDSYLNTAIANDSTNTLTKDQILKGTYDGTVRNPDGLWDIASGKLADSASGDVRIIAPFTDPNSVFIQTEIPALLNNDNIDSINGRPIGDFSGDLSKFTNEVKISSADYMKGLTQADIGTDIGKNGVELLSSEPGKLNALVDQAKTFGNWASEFGDWASKKLLVVGLTVTAFRSGKAYAAGDTELGDAIVKDAITSMFYDEFGELIVGTPVAILLAPVIAAGGVAALGAAAIVLAAALVGGEYGEELYDMFSDMATYLIDTPVSEMLSDMADVIQSAFDDLILTLDELGELIGNLLDDFANWLLSAFSSGDPHLTTFDGLMYDFHDRGEFTLVKSDDGEFEIQTRHEQWNQVEAAGNTAVATKLGDTKVGLYLRDTFPEDYLTSSDGDDYIRGVNSTNMTIDGGLGNDTINGYGNNNLLIGGDGDDLIYGNHGDDSIDGGADNDRLFGQENNDTLNGGAGDDVIIGGEDDGTVGDMETSGSVELVSTQGSFENSFGYYIKDANGNPVSGEIIWADTKNTSSGTTFNYDFDIGDYQLGFFLISNGDQHNTGLADGDDVTFQEVNGVWTVFKNGVALNSEYSNAPAFFSDSAFNADNYQHQTFDGTQQGWEDLINGGDESFNDVVINTTINETFSNTVYGDVLTGGTGADRFDYVVGSDGVDKITDFEDDVDVIHLSNVALEDVDITSVSGGSFIDFGSVGGGIFVENITPTDLEDDIVVSSYSLQGLIGDLPATDIPVLYANETPIILPVGAYVAIDGGIVYRSDIYDFTVVTETGDGFSANVYSSYINVTPFLAADRAAGSVKGLIGNADGDDSNEFQLRDGTDISDFISGASLYDVFGEDWRITQSESLFIYNNGENTSTWDDPNFVSQYITLDDFDPNDVATATSDAINAGFDSLSPAFDAIVMDFMLMGSDLELGDELFALEARDDINVASISNTPSNNLMMGNGEDETIYGTTAEDGLFALGGNDTVYGSSGNDTIVGGTGDDVLVGEAGSDTFIHEVGDGNDELHGYTYNYSYNNIASNTLAHVLMNGVVAEDLYLAVSGYDLIVTDTVNNEFLTLKYQLHNASYGHEFADVNGIDITGGLTLKGQSATAAETIHGTSYDDTIIGGLGDDTLVGNAGSDTFIHEVGDGNDELHGYTYNYTNYSSASNTLAHVLMNGVAAEDLYLNVSSNGYDLIVTDTVNNEFLTLKNQFHNSYYGYEFSTVNGNDITNGITIKGTSDTASELLHGTNSADTILAQAGNDTVYGDGGDDTIYGGTGDDVLVGEAGSDTFIHEVGDGNDELHGYTYNYTNYNSASNTLCTVTMNGVAAEDLYFSVSGYDLIVTNTVNNEFLTLKNQFHNTYYGYEFSTVNGIDVTGGLELKGTSATAAETINGTTLADTIIGGLGDDTLVGNAGSDTFIHELGDGNDELHGYTLNYSYNNTASNTLCTVTMNGVSSNDLYFNVSGYDLIVTDDATQETLTLKNQFQNTYYGYEFSTVNGVDVTGALTIKGSSSTAGESLYGTANGDSLIGGAGADSLQGAGGNDAFVYESLSDSTTTAQDLITDFLMGSDVIDLSGIASIDEFSDLAVSTSGGNTFIDDTNSDFSIQLTGTHALTASDFVFV